MFLFHTTKSRKLNLLLRIKAGDASEEPKSSYRKSTSPTPKVQIQRSTSQIRRNEDLQECRNHLSPQRGRSIVMMHSALQHHQRK